MKSLSALTALTMGMLALSGCLQDNDVADPDPTANLSPGVPHDDVLAAPASASYEPRVIPAVHQGHGLYEPTIDVSGSGVIYVSAHSTGVGAHPAPGYYSPDDGVTWMTLPFFEDQSGPESTQSSSPPFSDEIFIVAADDGSAWGVDINLRDYIVTGWCDDGAELCYYNPNAYDHAQVAAQAEECQPEPTKDRPWAAVSTGRLFMVNNPGGGPLQIGAMDVPPAATVDAGHIQSDIQWNLCASSARNGPDAEVKGFIPGIPDLRVDGFFAVPQLQGDPASVAGLGASYDRYVVVTGNVEDLQSVQERFVFNNTNIRASETDSTPSEISAYGQVAFDADGTMYFGAMNNTGQNPLCEPPEDPTERCPVVEDGGIHIAVSTDDGATFQDITLRFEGAGVSSIYLDGNRYGPGALLNWGLIDGDATDWYMGHLLVGDDGTPYLTNVMLAVDDGPEASRHVQGAAVGPDGRAYMVISEVSGNDDAAMTAAAGTTPMSTVVQMEGPVLPVQDT